MTMMDGRPAIDDLTTEAPPLIDALFGGDCDDCGSMIVAGDLIQADGRGGWLCEDCGAKLWRP